MKARTCALAAALVIASVVSAEEGTYPRAKVSYDDFKSLVAEVEAHRQERLVDLDTFLRMSREPGVVLLDTRSTFRYERIHLAGAKHLSFPDFTQDNLRAVIPSPETTVLIYCNNNFDGNEVDFATKAFRPSDSAALELRAAGTETPPTPGSQIRAQAKPLMLALNIPTFITLFGYGYRNVYELDELVRVTDPRLSFEGTVAAKK